MTVRRRNMETMLVQELFRRPPHIHHPAPKFIYPAVLLERKRGRQGRMHGKTLA
jgi:hypothetical protein